MSDEFEMQLQSLKPAGVSQEMFREMSDELNKLRRLTKMKIFGVGALAACIALVLILVPIRNAMREMEHQKQLIKLDQSNKRAAAIVTKLNKGRPGPLETLCKPDGSILTAVSDNIVYINLGNGDHIVPGFTFEVYAKDDGIPALGNGMRDDEMPVGVGSIEVEQVNAASSECRVVKLQPGLRILQGDLIKNLVYDSKVKNNFVIYGNFDLAQTGHPNLADADVIKSLVVGWGGKIQKGINIDTDFVVMGAEPVVEDLRADADDFEQQKHKDRLQAKADYQKVLAQAVDLHIPIMNQNRFLYFCGFYDLATR